MAIAEQPAGTTSLLLPLTPMLVAGAEMLALSEAPSSRQVAGSVIVAFGAVLFFMGDFGATVPGLVAATVCLVANVAGSVLGRHANHSAQVAPVRSPLRALRAPTRLIGTSSATVAAGPTAPDAPGRSGRARGDTGQTSS